MPAVIQKENPHHDIWQIAGPMILSNLSVPLLGLVDTAVLGHLNNASYLGAVAVGASVLTFIYWAFGFLRMGTTAIVSQQVGQQDLAEVNLTLYKGIMLALLLSSVVLMIQTPILTTAINWIGPDDDVLSLALSYSQIRIYSIPAVLVTYTFVGWFLGNQNAKAALIIVVSSNLVNLALDILLIIGLDMKSDGAAYATLCADYFGLLVAVFIALSTLRNNPLKIRFSQLIEPSGYRKLININRHLFVRTTFLLFTFTFFTSMGARQGNDVLAANAILLNLLLLTSSGLDGFAHAAESLSGKAIGAKNIVSFFVICKATTQWACAVALLFTSFFLLLDEHIISLFTEIPSVISSANQHYYWLCFMPLIGVWSYQLDGIFIGANKSRAMQNSMVLSVVCVFLPIWYLSTSLANHGLWMAFSAFIAARGISLGYLFFYYSKQQLWLY